MSTVTPGSCMLNMGEHQYDVYCQLTKTKYVPYEHIDPMCIRFSEEVMAHIRRYVSGNGYAGLSLCEYLDALYSTSSVAPL